MAGFNPVGSTPVGSIGSTTPSTSYTITSGNVNYTGYAPAGSFSFAPTKFYGLYVEVLHPGSPVAQFYGLYVEVLQSIQQVAGGGSISIIW